MAQGWISAKSSTDIYLPEIKGILGRALIGEASPEDDQTRNTDLIVLKLDTVRIACRIRQYRYLRQYGDEFTIRAGRPSGHKTELSKIIEGWGDYLFYGFSNESETGLARWFLGDLKVFRLWFLREIQAQGGQTPGSELYNVDRSSTFRAFSLSDMPEDFVIEASHAHFDGLEDGRQNGCANLIQPAGDVL